MHLPLISLLMSIAIGLGIYRTYVAAAWGVVASILIFLSNEFIVLFVNSTLISIVVLRGILDRFKRIFIIVFIVITLVKMLIFTDYYLEEKFLYFYYVVDGVFTALSIYLMHLYVFKSPRLGGAAFPALFTALLSHTPTVGASIVAGVVAALVEVKHYLVLLIALLNMYILSISGDISLFLPSVAFILTYIFTYKRLLYLSERPPVGWLYSWLGGRYKVTRILGVGGFSYVLAVRHKSSIYAAKILRYVDDYGIPLAGDDNVLRLFGQEMNRYIEIKSNYVVKAFEVYLPTVGYRDVVQYIKNPPYILLEYMEGGTLRDLMRQKIRVELGQVLEWFRQLAEGLRDIHKHNIAHLDIKPENILFTRDRKIAKIGDMGIAKVVAGGYVQSSYMSPAYAAPEVKKGVASFKSDVYSLGCVIYEILTGINPNVFVESGHLVPPPSVYNVEVPRWLDEILLRMLDVDPSRRPGADELVTYLNENLRAR